MSRRSYIKAMTLSLIASAAFVLACTVAYGEQPCAGCAPGWEVNATNFPTNLARAHAGLIEVEVFNVGGGSSEGPVTVTDTLPEGVTATDAGTLGARAGIKHPESVTLEHAGWTCSGNAAGAPPNLDGATVVTCTNEEGADPHFGGAGTLGYGSTPGEGGARGAEELGIAVEASATAEEDAVSPKLNHVTVAGGGAPMPASATDPITISSTPSPFRFTNFDAWFSNRDGTLDTQAGSHPYALTVNFGLATRLDEEKHLSLGGDEARNIEVQLPPGFVGDPTAVAQCTRRQFGEEACPGDSQIGIVMIQTLSAGDKLRLFNLVPPPGLPAELGFTIYGEKTYLDSAVRSGSDYGLTTDVFNAPQVEFYNSTAIIWGTPEDQSHDRFRNGGEEVCSEEEMQRAGSACSRIEKPDLKPFLTLPTACGASPKFKLRATSWQHPELAPIEDSVELHDSNGSQTGLTGCEHLGFAPEITTEPDTARADTPAGLTVEVKPPTGGLSETEGFSTSDIQNTTVTLPSGFVINPGQAAGLQACQSDQDGLTTEAEKAEGKENSGPAACPNTSKVGTDEIETPLLPHSLKGNVYVLQSNPPELKLLVTASGEGVNLKLVGIVHLNEQTGQLTTTFEGTPELPFTDFKLSFSGGAQAALDTPTQCGTYGTSSLFTPWSNPFVSDFLTEAEFSITEGPGGGACSSNPLPFAPSLVAGSTTDQAGGFTDFSLLLQRGDGQQRIERLQFKAPAGLSGIISSVPLCDEADANAGTCPAASHIGHAVVSSGPGPYPLVLPQPGDPELPIYLTGPYDGAPFGLSIVTPVLAGPFNLGTIVTRARIEVDPHTAAITVTTNPLPQIVAGVPTDLRSIDAVIDRPGFMFNPTNCNASSFSGTAWGTPPSGASGPGTTAAISSPFGVGSCQSLKFAPKFSVSTPGKTSKANGAGLTAKLSYPTAAQGTQADITRVKVDLPKQLPSRLTTLQKACTNAQFELNPANCPKESKIGYAKVTTQLLPVPLEGPAIFVSHGGEAFPSLTMVLQGDNVTVDLVGTTNISKAGITSTTFKTVPDVPFNTFTLTLGQGKFSALAANVPTKDHYSLCGQKLAMPTEFLAQNGLKINESTPISVSGCAKVKALTRGQKLGKALKACRKDKGKAKRVKCEAKARKQYGPIKKVKKK
jgi:hypothetical protein